MSALDLMGKPIAITGASSGIGAATALACARAGMPVALAARRVDRLEALAGQINREGGRAIAVPCDVARVEDCERLIAGTVEAFGSVYSVYANAGYGVEAAALDLPDAQWRAIFETNFWGTLNTIRPAAAHMVRAGRGHVLICSSCLSRITLPFYSAYSATKAAQAHVGRAMRLELEPRGVYVSTVHPISTETEFSDSVRTETGRPRTIRHIPKRFSQTPEQVAAATVRCLRRPRAEVWTSTFTRLGMAVSQALPGIEDFFALRAMAKKKRAARAERGDA